MEHQIKRDGAAQDFGQIAGSNGHFADQPVRPARPFRIPVTAALGEILSRHDAQTGGDDLHENRHNAGQGNHPQEAVLEACPCLQIRSPVPRIHVTDADQNCGTDESPPLLPEASLVIGDLHGTVHAFQRQVAFGQTLDSEGVYRSASASFTTRRTHWTFSLPRCVQAGTQ